MPNGIDIAALKADLEAGKVLTYDPNGTSLWDVTLNSLDKNYGNAPRTEQIENGEDLDSVAHDGSLTLAEANRFMLFDTEGFSSELGQIAGQDNSIDFNDLKTYVQREVNYYAENIVENPTSEDSLYGLKDALAILNLVNTCTEQ